MSAASSNWFCDPSTYLLLKISKHVIFLIDCSVCVGLSVCFLRCNRRSNQTTGQTRKITLNLTECHVEAIWFLVQSQLVLQVLSQISGQIWKPLYKSVQIRTLAKTSLRWHHLFRAHTSKGDVAWESMTRLHLWCRCRNVPVCDVVQLHGGRGVHGPRDAASERRRGLWGRQGVHHKSGHRCFPLRAEECTSTHRYEI